MNSECLVTIKGLHFDVSQNANDLEVVLPGKYSKRGDFHYIIYDEPVEGTDYVNKNMIKFNDHTMTLTKKGVINATMLFDTSSKNLTNYNTPYGSIVFGIETHSVNVDVAPDMVHLNISYSLDLNYELLSKSTIDILIKSASDTII